MRSCFILLSCILLVAACEPIGQRAGIGIESIQQAIEVQYDGTGIHYIDWNGVNIFENVGGYYIIGSCTGADTADQNVISLGSDGHTLHAPGQCPGAPFSIQFSGTNPIHVNISVGPLPVDYRSLSVPFDPTMAYFDSFLFSSSGYLVGCANTWSPRSGSGGLFSDIPQPCNIPGHGAVGLARVTDPYPGWWGEISGSVVTVRRTILGGNIQEAVFINHPYTHNMELSFQVEPVSEHILPAGSVYTLEEEISFRDPGSQPSEASEVISVDIPSSASAGSTIEAVVTLLNTGDTTWSEPADHMGGTRLGSLTDNELVWIPGESGGYFFSESDQRLYLPSSVAPGQQVAFQFGIQLPQQPGTYQFSAQMVHDGVAWFGDEIRRSIEAVQGPCGDGEQNSCGGCSTLEAQPGTSCGTCGTYTCEGTDSVRCDDKGSNSCGGCATLGHEQGLACGKCGVYVCDGLDSVRCQDPGYNECGTCGPVTDGGCEQDGVNDGDGFVSGDQVADAGMDAGDSGDYSASDSGHDADHEQSLDSGSQAKLNGDGCGCYSASNHDHISWLLLICSFWMISRTRKPRKAA